MSFVQKLIMLNVANKPFMLSAIMLNVVMLNVVMLNVAALITIRQHLRCKMFYSTDPRKVP
jgi:hypothetical protein